MPKFDFTSGRRLRFIFIVLLAAGLLQCTGPTATAPGEIELAITPVPGGGFNDAGVQSSIPELAFDETWFYIPGFLSEDSCLLRGQCSAGGNIDRFGKLTAPFNPEAIPAPDGNPSLFFGFIATQNFFSFNGELASVHKSGIQKTGLIIPTTAGKLRLKFDYAFLSGDYNTGPAHNDVAQVLLLDQNNRTLATVLRLERDLLQPGGSGAVAGNALPLPEGGGAQTLAGVTANYPLCTDWRSHSFDLTSFKGQTVTLRLLVEEVGGKNEHPVALLYDNFRMVEYR